MSARRMHWWVAVMLMLFISIDSEAQTSSSRSHVFPLFADGATNNGIVYRSSLKIINLDSATPAVDCTVTQRKTSAAFVGIYGDRYFADVFEAGDTPAAVTAITLDRFLPWEVLRSTARSGLELGYATLSCSHNVHSELHIALTDSNGTKFGESLMAPATPGMSFEFFLNRRDGTRLGFSLINDSAAEGEYTVIARDEFHHEVNRAYDTLGAWSQVSRFIDEILDLPPNFVGTIEILGVNGGRSYVAGLQFTGAVFATVAPIVRAAPLRF